jgi:phosphatidate cytidylyltransferase
LKTRIISGVVAAALVAALLVLNSFWNITVIIAVSVFAALGVYEILHNTGCIKNMFAVIIAMLYAAAMQFSYAGIFIDEITLSVIYAVIIVFFAVFDHKNFGDRQITMALAMPPALSLAFACLSTLINAAGGKGIFYFVLLFNFACVSDIFAYFVGSAMGKHKLAPEISPKKTIEGAVGGLVGSVLGTLVVCLAFEAILKTEINILALLLVTPVLSVCGMLGDLFASAIKRNYGIKDYGNIMPGHGGVLDRTDSILLVAPVLVLFLNFVSVV